MDTMTSRERFRRTLNHQEPDRVPIDVGQDLHNGIHEVAYRNLLTYIGEEDEIERYCKIQHLGKCKESILKRLHADTRYIFAGGASDYRFKVEEDGSWLDEWGVRRRPCGLYDENIAQPLRGCGLEEVKAYKVPDPYDPGRFAGLKEKAKELYDNTEYALIGGSPGSLFYLSSEIVGFEEYLEKLLLEPLVIETLVDRVLEFNMGFFDKYLDAVGEYIEMVWIGDDWGTQSGPMMNPRIFREIFMRRYKELTSFIKKKADVKICLHSCGSVYWAMEDLIEAGIDVLHPLQAAAAGMGDPEKLKRDFGDRLVFYSNLSNQTLIPYGTPEQVRSEVIEKIRYLAPGGGYIISAGHNIQADVPPENLITVFDAAYEFGKYPMNEV